MRGLYRGAENALGASRFLMADVPPNPARRPEYAIAVSRLCRSILDALCSLVFVFGDFSSRVLWSYTLVGSPVSLNRGRIEGDRITVSAYRFAGLECNWKSYEDEGIDPWTIAASHRRIIQ